MKTRFRITSVALAAALTPALAAAPPGRPDIVLLLSDDQGWCGLSVPMHPELPNSKSDFYRTPNLEKFAAQGMRFSDAYAPAPVCSPTRISLQTGMSPARLRWTKAAPPVPGQRLIEAESRRSIRADEVTIAEMLKAAGYATAHYGKWHLSGGGPAAHGFDDSDGDTGNQDADPFVDPNPVDIFGMGERAAAFMAKHSKAGTPFFVQMSYHALHRAQNALRATRESYEKLPPGRMHRDPARAAITTDLDTGVGRLLETIDRLGIAGSTYVIYTSDNGDGTVTDQVTGLMWQKADGGEMTWEQAREYAGKLRLGGHRDWRLPVSMELFSIVDHGEHGPAMDTAFFARTEAGYWSSTSSCNRPQQAWFVDFTTGLVSHADKPEQFLVLAVRGGVAAPGSRVKPAPASEPPERSPDRRGSGGGKSGSGRKMRP